MTRNSVDILIDCVPEFRLPARYVFTMLGLISGFKPRFIRREELREHCVYYGNEPVSLPPGALRLPASPDAQRALTIRNPVVPDDAPGAEVLGVRCLPLFPAATGTDPSSVTDTHQADSLQFDLIAAAFFFLSLHEEWTSAHRDAFDRFQAGDSLLGARGLMDRPVVAEYAGVLGALLTASGHEVSGVPRFAGKRSAVCMTHDIDYLSKRTPGLLWRECVEYFLLNQRGVSLRLRARRLKEYFGFFRSGRDPYRISLREFLEQEHRRGIRATYFIKTGAGDKRDVAYNARSRVMRSYLRTIAELQNETGLHPSFRSYRDPARMARERDRLKRIIEREVGCVRQHYLRLAYPETWNAQQTLGFSIDSSLGFAESEGFRNGTCHPFLPFDLERMRPIPMWEIPLHSMDGTFAFYRRMSPEAALTAMTRQLETVRSHGGVWNVLFHNTAYDGHDFPGWDAVYLKILEVSAFESFTGTLSSAVDAWLTSSPFIGMKEIVDTINN